MDGLLIIDVQQGLLALPDFPLYDREGTVARIRTLLDHAREMGTPIFFVQHDGGEEIPSIACGSPGFALPHVLQPGPGEHVTVKRHCNSFQDTDLNALLRDSRVDHLIVCGMMTEFCVDTAVRAAVERGYRVTLVKDAHTTGDSVLRATDKIAHHNATLGAEFATLRTAAEIVRCSEPG